MRVKFTTNIDEKLLKEAKMTAIKEGRNVNEIIEEQLEKYLEEGNDMKKIIVECLEILREEQLLNSIGEQLAEEPERFPETIENMADYFENQSREYVLDKLSTSSLVGADDELAIQEWIDEEEQGTMYRIIDIIDVENDVEMQEIHDGEWVSVNGRWSVTRNGVYRNIGESSELVGDMEDIPDAVQKVYDQLQGD